MKAGAYWVKSHAFYDDDEWHMISVDKRGKFWPIDTGIGGWLEPDEMRGPGFRIVRIRNPDETRMVPII